jgi:hypothetical protein
MSLASSGVDNRRIDEEDDRHVHCLARLQFGFGKAETLDLVEIGPGRHRRDVEGRLAGVRHVERVPGGVGDLNCLADPEFDFPLHRLEVPRQTAEQYVGESKRTLMVRSSIGVGHLFDRCVVPP